MLRQLLSPTRRLTPLLLNSRNSTAVAQSFKDEWGTAKPYEELPGPKPLPLIGNIWRFLPYIGEIPRDILEQQKYLQEKFGNIVKLPKVAGLKDMVMLYNPEDIEKVFRNEGPWPIREGITSAIYYRKVHRKDFFEGVGGGLLAQGEEWQTFRSKVNPIMLQPRSTKLYIQPIDAVTQDFINRIRKIRDEKQEMPDDFGNELNKWALESISYVVLDTRLGCLADDLTPDSEPQKMINAVKDTLDAMYILDLTPNPWRYISTAAWRKFVKATDYFTDVSMKYINQAMERLKALPDDGDRELTLLEKLLARDSNPTTGIVMALDMMGAGVDTTSYSSANVLYFLAMNPDKQENLLEELSRHIPDKHQPVTTDILNNLKYLKACIKESMRLKPVTFGNSRTVDKDMVLSGYRVPKNCMAVMPHFYLCQKEEYFPQADKYIPERWLKSRDGDRSTSNTSHPFVYLPFGFGPRMCVGRRFAELEMETLVAKIVRNFKIEFHYGDLKYQSKLLYIPVSPLKFRFVDRK